MQFEESNTLNIITLKRLQCAGHIQLMDENPIRKRILESSIIGKRPVRKTK
jgi:hypothetical protein